MLRASEANKETTKNITEFLTTEMTEIEKRIINAIKEGKYSICYSGYLKQETKDALKRLGYKVETGSQYNESYYSISWK